MIDFLRRTFSSRDDAKIPNRRRLSRVRMIACDVDGTLLNREERVSPRIIELVKAIVEHGTKFALITRRHHNAASEFTEDLGITSPIISLDGALTMEPHSDRPMFTITFDQPFARDIISEIQDIGGIEFCVVTARGLYLSHQSMTLPAQYQHRQRIPMQVISDGRGIEEDILEISAAADFFGVNKVYDYIEGKARKNELKVRLHETPNGGIWHLTVRSALATKENALERLLKQYGIPFKNTVGIGDHYNDLDFCERSGYVVAVRNAIEEMKQIADFVTEKGCFDDGIAEFFELFLETQGFNIMDLPSVRARREMEQRYARSR